MIHKIPIQELITFIQSQPDTKKIVMNQNLGLVSELGTGCYIFQFCLITDRIKPEQRIACGYSSLNVKDGNTFEFGVTPSERQQALDINIEALHYGVGDYGGLKMAVEQVLKTGAKKTTYNSNMS